MGVYIVYLMAVQRDFKFGKKPLHISEINTQISLLNYIQQGRSQGGACAPPFQKKINIFPL